MIAPRGKGKAWKLAMKIPLAGISRGAPLLMILLAAVMPVQVSAQSGPSWVSPLALGSTDGVATLKWSVTGDDPIALFRVIEEHGGALQVSYTDQPQLQVSRREQGKYTFRVQVCTRLPDGYPQCGEVSPPLVLTVAGTAVDTEPIRSPGKRSLAASLLRSKAPQGRRLNKPSPTPKRRDAPEIL